MWTILQMVGSLVIFYAPLASVGIYEGFSGSPSSPRVFTACLVALMNGPVFNAFVFGLKNKVGT